MAQLSLGKFKFRYFYGYLETIIVDYQDFINRYITGRCLQYSNEKNLVIGGGEVAVLAGPYRGIDFAYLNPLSLHLENDFNHHVLSDSVNLNNAIWSFYTDWRCRPNLRLSASLILDEIKLEWQERAQGEPDIMGYFARLAWTPYCKALSMTLIAHYSRLDTYLAQHSYAYANFVNREIFIGDSIGNDADKISCAVRLVFPYSTLSEIEYGRYRWGENSLLNNPYTPYYETIIQPFPSGQKSTRQYLALRLYSQPLKCLSFSLGGEFALSHSGAGSSLEKWIFACQYQLPVYLLKW